MNLNVERILVIGLGMIGASIALASRSKGIKVTGYDIDSISVKNAFQKQIIDHEASSIEQINSKEYTKDIDLIILAINHCCSPWFLCGCEKVTNESCLPM